MNISLSDGLDVADYNMTFTQWPPKSTDFSLTDFFLWGYKKNYVFVPSLSVESKQCITIHIDGLDSDTLTHVRAKIDYQFNVCHVTKGSHIDRDVLRLLEALGHYQKRILEPQMYAPPIT
ncbi:hypothetical protein TNCV_2332851 [Trichonephila clavipes]|nr:hypothetical protein TNCV_2332851 [Trichonephila clavipes]